MKIWIFGKPIVAADALGIVKGIHARALFDQNKSLEQYMAGVAARTLTHAGHVIRTDSPDAFIADLIATVEPQPDDSL